MALRLEPYESGVVLPHERTHAGPKEGRLRLLRATRTQLEPIFLLHDGDPVEPPSREPDLALGGERLWRLDSVPDLADRQLLIADGHHRYETALAFHEEDGTEASAWMMVVLVSTQDEGLTIFPTHRIAQHVERRARNRDRAPRRTAFPGSSSTRATGTDLVEGDGLDVELVESLRPEGVAYTAHREEAEAAVDRGDAEAALLVRPTPIEAVFERARRGEVLPQKTTYFFPKLTSGCSSTRLTDWLALCRGAVDDVRGVLVDCRRAWSESRCSRGARAETTRRRSTRRPSASILARFDGRSTRRSCREEVGELGGGRRRVVIDPIDGSLNAKRGIPFFSLSIAVADGATMGDVQFAYVYDFGSGEEWTATRGDGAFLERRAARRAAARRSGSRSSPSRRR